MKDHVISGPCSTVQIANSRLPILITELIKNEPRDVHVNRIKTGGPQSDWVRFHIENLNPAGAPFNDTVKATIKPCAPALDAVGATQMYRHRKGLFGWDVRSGPRKAVRHSHACQRNLRLSFGTKHD